MQLTKYAKFAWGTLGWNILVILWGAMVRATGSGAGCGSHWPTCNGQVLPEFQQTETIIEFTHRAMSGIALILVLILLLWGLRLFPKGHPARIGIIGSAVFILIEALLGAGLVLFKLVAENSSIFRAVAIALHLLNTFILLSFLTLAAWWGSEKPAITLKNKGPWPLLFVIGLVGTALIGMSGAITALGDTLFPSESIRATLEAMNDPGAHFLVDLRVYHPVIAILIGMYLLQLVRWLYANHQETRIRRFSLMLGALILIQWTAGFINVFLLAPLWMQVIHLFLADSVWISLVLLAVSKLAVEETL